MLKLVGHVLIKCENHLKRIQDQIAIKIITKQNPTLNSCVYNAPENSSYSWSNEKSINYLDKIKDVKSEYQVIILTSDINFSKTCYFQNFLLGWGEGDLNL